MVNEMGPSPPTIMNDLIYVGVIVAFFVISGLYVRYCEKLSEDTWKQ